jgi:hypothetical protein
VEFTRPACKSRLNRKFQENNFFGTKKQNFLQFKPKIKDKTFGN